MPALDSIFYDAASLILRAMLARPDRSWVVRDFVRELRLGQGWVASVLRVLRDKGFTKGKGRGRLAGSVLRDANELVREWTRHYQFEQNKTHVFYSAEPNILQKIKRFFKEKASDQDYALSFHSGANLMTGFVKDPNVYLYLKPERFDQLTFDLRLTLDLKELKRGGNVYLIYPYYKRSVFFNLQKIRGFSAVSNLQLYLDLFHFPGRGREHAEHLLRFLEEKGQNLA